MEVLIEHANEQYKAKGVALIQKVATPWTVIRRGKQIVSAFPAEKSTIDFIGVANGKSIAFDAKQCHLKTSFPLKNIEPHQIYFMCQWWKNGGVPFWLIEMTSLGEVYRVDHFEMLEYWNVFKGYGRKSIPIKDFDKFEVVGQAGGIVLDYLCIYS